jgi:SAM-dependent methyltransferase
MAGSRDILAERRKIWQSKKILKKLYFRWYQRIGDALVPGTILELGGGSGNLKEYFPHCFSTDILFSPWLDAVLDAQELPFSDQSLSNIVLFDVLHHLIAPTRFFREAERVLRSGGRVILMEPYISWVSYFAYRFFHKEGLDQNGDPFDPRSEKKEKDPFAGNQAVPSLIFERYRERFEAVFPRLRILNLEPTDFFAYPLSGGFHGSNLHPLFLWDLTERIEGFLKPLAPYLAFRIFIVLEKT